MENSNEESRRIQQAEEADRVGSGKRLFKVGSDMQKLKLVDSKVTGSGVVILTYRPTK